VYDRDALMMQHKRLRRDVSSAATPLSLHIKANSRYVLFYVLCSLTVLYQLLLNCVYQDYLLFCFPMNIVP
jgi:hypothetical protein